MKSICFIFVLSLLVLSGCAATTEYPSTPAFNRYTPEDILQMVKQGEPTARIINRLEAAGSFYPYKASELIRLHQQGMPLELLDYIQGTYIGTVRHQERFRWPYRF